MRINNPIKFGSMDNKNKLATQNDLSGILNKITQLSGEVGRFYENGKINTTALPSLAITDVHVINFDNLISAAIAASVSGNIESQLLKYLKNDDFNDVFNEYYIDDKSYDNPKKEPSKDLLKGDIVILTPPSSVWWDETTYPSYNLRSIDYKELAGSYIITEVKYNNSKETEGISAYTTSKLSYNDSQITSINGKTPDNFSQIEIDLYDVLKEECKKEFPSYNSDKINATSRTLAENLFKVGSKETEKEGEESIFRFTFNNEEYTKFTEFTELSSALSTSISSNFDIIQNIGGNLNTLSGNVNTLSGNVNTISGNVNNISGIIGSDTAVYTGGYDLSMISAAFSAENTLYKKMHAIHSVILNDQNELSGVKFDTNNYFANIYTNLSGIINAFNSSSIYTLSAHSFNLSGEEINDNNATTTSYKYTYEKDLPNNEKIISIYDQDGNLILPDIKKNIDTDGKEDYTISIETSDRLEEKFLSGLTMFIGVPISNYFPVQFNNATPEKENQLNKITFAVGSPT